MKFQIGNRCASTALLFGLVFSGSSGALAQVTNCNVTASDFTGPTTNLVGLASIGAATSAAFVGAISQINTAFIAQQGSAFVSAPPNPAPDQPGGGAWVRGVGGEASTKSVTTSTLNQTTPAFSAPTVPLPGGFIGDPSHGASSNNMSLNCLSSQRTNFGGAQVGQDIARLNWGGWNVHLGGTAGYLSATSVGDGFTTNFEVPFLGAYVVATNGRFFADLLVRRDFVEATISNPGIFVPSTPVGARGISIATSAGYNVPIANNWFIEPSAGFIWSNTKVDSFTEAGGSTAPPLGIVPAASIATSDILSEIGRLSLRVGTTFESGNVNWQPFATVSVFHEFAGAASSTASSNRAYNAVTFSNPNTGVPFPGTFFGGPTFINQQSSTSRIGTYGQYSIGIAGQIQNTGWLGFARADYRNGSNIEGWAGNAGVRYQFTPEMAAAVMPTKAPVKALPIVSPTNWTGLYVGGFLGAAYGRSDIRFVDGTGNNPWIAGGLGGGQVGYNYQVNSWVFGVEADIGGTNLHGARTCGTSSGRDPNTFLPNSFSPFFLTCGANMNWLATAAARVGWASGRTLFFAKAGGAWTDETTTIGCVITPANNADFGTTGGTPANPNYDGFNNHCRNPANVVTNGFNTGGTRAGWTIGFGTEFDLGKNWSAKAEYDYIDFGSRTALASDGTTVLRTSTTVSQVKVGVNYRFGPGFIVAKN